jgi:hypothetical protein
VRATGVGRDAETRIRGITTLPALTSRSSTHLTARKRSGYRPLYDECVGAEHTTTISEPMIRRWGATSRATRLDSLCQTLVVEDYQRWREADGCYSVRLAATFIPAKDFAALPPHRRNPA